MTDTTKHTHTTTNPAPALNRSAVDKVASGADTPTSVTDLAPRDSESVRGGPGGNPWRPAGAHQHK